MEYEIKTTWNNHPIDERSVTLSLSSSSEGMVLNVSAPFFNDPPNPGGLHGQSFPKLWDFEVVEAFFLNDKEQYLEVELCPHGQHLVLLLNGVRKAFKDHLPIKYQAKVTDNTWTGRATIPWEYFPPLVSKFNAYAIHGSGTARAYWSLYPVPKDTFDTPDFHRLEYFQPADYDQFWPKSDTFRQNPSSHWRF